MTQPSRSVVSKRDEQTIYRIQLRLPYRTMAMARRHDIPPDLPEGDLPEGSLSLQPTACSLRWREPPACWRTPLHISKL
jgi:hypothetical protein